MRATFDRFVWIPLLGSRIGLICAVLLCCAPLSAWALPTCNVSFSVNENSTSNLHILTGNPNPGATGELALCDPGFSGISPGIQQSTNGTSALGAFYSPNHGGSHRFETTAADDRITYTPAVGFAGTETVGACGEPGTTSCGTITFIVQAIVPSVTSVSPASGSSAGGTIVTLTGSAFTGATAVKFGGTAASSFTVNGDTGVTATAPAHAAGTVDITVTTAGGTSATGAADQYTYVAPPTVSSVSPTQGSTSGGTSVTITGTGFTGATAVRFGASNATSYTVTNPTHISATAPAGLQGTVDITVTTGAGTSPTGASDHFTYIGAPTVTSVNPGSGSTAGGDTITITGTNFVSVTAITFGGTNVTGATVLSSTSISATNPAHAAGTVDVVVTGIGGNSSTNVSDRFTYTTIVLSPASPLTAATVGSAYSQTITASGGTAPYTFAVTAGSLPAGLGLNSAGTLSGTPTAGGTFNFSVTATDANTSTGTQAYSLTVNAPTIALSPSSLPAATVGSSYSQSIAASGGTSSYSFAITAGALPAGVSLASNGTLSGTPTAGGTFNFTTTATDSSTGTGPYTGSRVYSLTVNAPTISVSPNFPPNQNVAQATNVTFTASGGSGPYTFAITSGSLPAGIALSSSGVLSGTASQGGTFNFTVAATDSSTGTGPYTGTRAYTLLWQSAIITTSPTTLPNATVGTSYSQTISASGGTSPYTFAVTVGVLPTGLSLSSSTGVLSGTPTAGGSFNFTVTATDSSTGTGPYTGNGVYTLTVSSTAPNAPSNATATGGNMQATVDFNASTSDGGSAITGYTVTSNPAGGVDSNAGSIGLSHLISGLTNGTPYTFTVVATNAVGDSDASAESNSVIPATFTFTADCNAGSGDGRLNIDVYLYIGQTAAINTQNCSFAYTSANSPDTISPTANGGAAVSSYFFTKNSGTDSGSYGLNVYRAGVYGFLYYFHPTLTLATSGGATAWTESNTLTAASTPVAIDSGVTVGDHLSPTLSSATVSITGNFQSSEDVLAFSNDGVTMGDVSATYASGTGILTLASSGATLAQWRAALAAVTYNDTAQPPTGSSRTISFVVNDGAANSATATKTINLATVNHPPIFTLGPVAAWPAGTHGLETVANFATVTSFGQPGEEGQSVSAYHVTDTMDPEGVISGGSSGVLIQNDGTLVYSLSGQSGTATISVQCQDDGGTINGGNDTAAAQTFTITVGNGWNLSIRMDDHTGGKNFFRGGDLADYTIKVENIGTSDVHAATVQDALPSNLLDARWSCDAIASATCAASGSGSISDTVDIPKNGAVIYHLTATVQANPEVCVTNTATATTRVAEPDIDMGNNTATTMDAVGVYADGFELLSYPFGMDIPVTANSAQTRAVTLDASHATLQLQPLLIARVHDTASPRTAEVHLRQHLDQTEVRLSWRGDDGLWRPGAWLPLTDPTHLMLAWSTEAGSYNDWPLAEAELDQGTATLARAGTDL